MQIAGGLHERCTYFCFDVNGDTDATQLTPLAEKQFYANLYDDLLSSTSINNQVKYSLVQVFFIIKLFGYRTLIWSKESFSFLQPRLNELKKNKPCNLIHDTAIFRTKQQMAIRRRSAEHVVRYSCLIQMLINALMILKSIDENVIKNSEESISELFEIEAKKQVNICLKRCYVFLCNYSLQINKLFGFPIERHKAFRENSVPIKPLQVGLEATKSAVVLVFSLLLPQSVILFNYENCNENKSIEGEIVDNINLNSTKQEKAVFRIEKFILDLNAKFFFKSSITDRHFRDKRILVDSVLNALVARKMLHEGHGDTSFFNTGRVSSIKTYLKYLPIAADEERFRENLKRLYNIDYENYKKKFQDAPVLPPSCQLTPYGLEFIRQPQYELIMYEKGKLL